MRRRNPDYRARLVLRAETAAVHPLENALFQIVHKNAPFDEMVSWAYDIYTEQHEREIMQAFLLAEATDADIYQRLRIPPPVTQAYRYLFFDLTLFRDELHILTWVKSYEDGKQGTAYGAQLLRDAMTYGVKRLHWLFGRGEVEVEAEVVQRRVMADTFFRGQAQRMYKIDSEEAKAAHALSKTALGAAVALNNKVDNSGVNALAIRLLHREMTTPVEEERPEDVPLH